MEADKPVNPRVFAPLALAGVAMMLWGGYGLFANAAMTRPGSWFTWFLGAAIVHDLVVAPIVFVAGSMLARAIPSELRAPIQAAIAVTLLVFAATLPLVLGLGSSGEPSVLGGNYAAGLLAVVVGVWVTTALVAGRAWRRRRTDSGAQTG